MPRPVAVSLLVVTTVLWGLAFVFQKTAMDTRRPMADVAQALLLTEEVGHSRPAKP